MNRKSRISMEGQRGNAALQHKIPILRWHEDNKYLRADWVNHVKRECSFCVEWRAKVTI